MRKVNPELGLVLIIFVIAAMLNFLAASHMALMFYFLPTLYSAYRFGRRHATLTACASVAVVVLLNRLNPTVFTKTPNIPFDSRWFDIMVWGGILVVCGYAMGTLYERNQKSLTEMKTGYDGMLAVLESALASQKRDSHTARVSYCATRIGECLGLDAASLEDVRIASLLHNINEAGVSNDILMKAANLSEEQISRFQMRGVKKTEGIGGSLQRVIPIVVAGQQLTAGGGDLADAPIEVQVVAMAEEYESLCGKKDRSAAEAQEIIAGRAGKKYDSLIVDALQKAFAEQASAAKA